MARNGYLIFAAHALSFIVQDSRDFLQEYESVAWRISDMRSQDEHIPIAIVSYPQRGQSKSYENARRLSDALNVSILTERNVGSWTWDQVKDLVLK